MMNDTAGVQSRSDLTELLEHWSRTTPDALAIIASDATLTYAELDARAERLACRLHAQGVGPEIPVGVCAERSAALLTAVMAIFKVGGVYLPLDPRLPNARMRHMIEAAGARVLLKFGSSESFPDVPAITTIDLDDPSIGESCGSRVISALHPEHAAYLIYTSGSTGEPRGVIVTRAGLPGCIAAQRDIFEVLPADRVLAFSSIGFDASIFELCLAVGGGATLVTADREALMPGAMLASFVKKHGVTIATLTPTVLATLNTEDLSGLRKVLVMGETSPDGLLQSWAQGRRVFNAYGPTEATIWSSTAEIRRADESLTIGHPVSGVRVGVLNDALRKVPPGATGELYVSGDCVARGYVDMPGKTAERFVPDCLDGPPGARMYRTGDRVKLLPDGRLEFLGRIDHQVKIRGYRVEPGEVEAAIVAAGAKRAVVVPRRDTADLRLVAYVVDTDSAQLAAASGKVTALREALAARLPEYMIPAAWVFLDELPIGQTGKVDRAALPPPPTDLDEGKLYVAPCDAIEQALARIWADTLGHPRVSITDNFYELGGDSMLGIHIAGKAAQEGLYFSPVEVMRRQTIAALAPIVERAPSATEEAELPGPVPLTPIQRWFVDLGLSAPHYFNQSHVIDILEPPDLEVLERAFAHVVEHHDALRLRYELRGADMTQIQERSAPPIRIQRFDIAGLPDDAQRKERLHAMAKLHASFDLAHGPLVHVGLFELGGGRAKLFLTIHHLVVDAVSWYIILTDLDRAYAALRGGKPVTLPARTTSFQAWSRRLSGYARSPELGEQLAFWRDQPWEKVTPLPMDVLGGSLAVADAETFSFDIEENVTERLLREAPAVHGAKIQELLLAAFVLALRAWTGSTTLLVDVEGHGRENLFPEVNLSRTVGWFTTVYPVLIELDKPGIEAAVAAVHERIQRIPQRGIGFGLLRHLHGDKASVQALASVPKAQISFNYLGQWDHTLKDSTLMRLTADNPGPRHAPEDSRPHMLEFALRVIDGKLECHLRYGSKLHHRKTIEGIVASFRHYAREIAGSRAVTVPRADAYPLTSMQLGMLHHTLKNIDGGQYVVQSLLDIEGDLDENALTAAFRSLTARHAALRTSFVWEDLLEPAQIERDSVDVPFETIHATGVSPNEREARIAALCEADRRRGHDPRNAPLFRVALLRWSSRESTLLWSFHHLILDELSGSSLLRELFRHYDAHRRGAPIDLPPAPSVRAFVEWQRAAGTPEAYWRAELEGFQGATDPGFGAKDAAGDLKPPMYKPGVEIPSTSNEPRDELRERIVPATIEAELRAFARREHVPLITVITAAWTIVLARYSGQTDVVFGLTLSGRSAKVAGIDSLIGNLLNTLPLRVTFEKNETLSAFILRLHGRILALRDHEASSLARIQTLRNAGRSRTLFDHILVFDHLPEKLSHPDLAIGNVRTIERTNYPLNLVVLPDGPIALRALFDVRRFAPDAMDTLLQHLGEVLAAMPKCADRPVDEIPCGAPRREIVKQPIDVAGSAAKPMVLPGHAAPRTDDEKILTQVFADVLGRSDVGIRDNFFDLGGDSIQSFQIVARAGRAGLIIKNSQIFEHQTVEELARVAQKKSATSLPRPANAPSLLAPLLPIQRWFFELPPTNPAQFDYHLLLRVDRSLAPDPATRADVLRRALFVLALRHEALRGRFQVLPATVAQRFAPMRTSEQILEIVDVPAASDHEALNATNQAIEARPPALHLARGPVFRAVLFEHGEAAQPHLLLVVHHLVSDVISLRVLLEDLVSACAQSQNSADIDIPAPTVSYAAWGERIERYATSERVMRQRDHWIAQVGGARLPRDHFGENHFDDARRTLVTLPEDWTAKLLADRPAKTSPRPVDFLLAALFLSFRDFSGAYPDLTLGASPQTPRGIMLEGHGRADLDPDLDLSRTIGWFTAMYPMLLAIEEKTDPLEVLDQVRSATTRLPDGGVGYGALKYVARDAELLAAIEARGEPEIAFNFLGRVEPPSGGSSFTFAVPDKPIVLRRSGGARRYLIEVDAFIRDGRLLVQWTYGARIHEERTIQALANAQLEIIRGLLEKMSSAEKTSPKAANFPLASLSQKQLDSIAAKIKRPKA